MKRVPLTQGKTALVSDRDYWLVRQFNWYAALTGDRVRSWYAGAKIAGQGVLMHRLLASFPPFHLDHRNRNGLDNRRSNLRPATSVQNQANAKCKSSSAVGLKGVDKLPSGRYRAYIGGSGTRRHLGVFDAPEAAHIMYCFAALYYFGDFARAA